MFSSEDYWETTLLSWNSYLMDVSGEHQGSHLPQEQENGAASVRMFMARKSAPQFEVSFCSLLPCTDWLILFQIILLQYESV